MKFSHSTISPVAKGSIGLFTVIVVFLVLIVIGVFTYLLFFSSPPRVATLLPPALQSVNEISRVQFVDLLDIVNSQEFKSLESYGVLTSVGNVGRPNPFIDYRTP
jgi:flagellar basal body-associated protein FliL